MPTITDVIENKGLVLDQSRFYAAILGESPSKGAKSPLLWNAAFKGLGLSGMMHPMDILPRKLEAVVERLREDRRYIGGAVAMPYKMTIIPFLDSLEPEAATIGAVNCIYRQGEKLVGTNTDGAGALWSLETAFKGSLTGKSAILIGTGGAGCAVAAFLAKAVGGRGKMILINRSMKARDELVNKLAGVCPVETGDWPVVPEMIEGIDLLINCSSIGFEIPKKDERGGYSLKFFTPLGPVDDAIRMNSRDDINKQYAKKAHGAIGENIGHSLKVLGAMDSPFIYDIIYQPQETMLLYLSRMMGYRTMNGTSMNLEQAVIAFEKATIAAGMRESNSGEIRKLMKEVW